MKNFNFYTSSADDQAFYIKEPAGWDGGAHWFKLKPGWTQACVCQAQNPDQLELVAEIEARDITQARQQFQKQLRGEVTVLPDF
jgi:hypothetical protein